MKWLLSAMEVGQQLLCTYRLLCLCAAKLFVFFLLWCICYFSGWISAWQECTYSEASQGWICAGRYWKAMERHKCKLSFGCPYCKSLDYKRFPPLLLFMPFTECWDNGLEADFARRYCSHLLGHVLLMLFVFFCTVNQVGIYMPCYDIFRNSMEEFTIQNCPALTPYVPLVAGAVARSISCITCYPVELARTRMQVVCLLVLFFSITYIKVSMDYWLD